MKTMPSLIIGLLLLYLVLAGIKQFARLSPTAAARLVRQGGGVLGLLGALLLALRGSLGLASLVAGVAFSFAGWAKLQHYFAAGLGQWRRWFASRSTIQRSFGDDRNAPGSRDWRNGRNGLVRPLQGRPWRALTRPDCLDFIVTTIADDPDGARLLETYLDRRFAGWREATQGQGDARRGESAAPAR